MHRNWSAWSGMLSSDGAADTNYMIGVDMSHLSLDLHHMFQLVKGTQKKTHNKSGFQNVHSNETLDITKNTTLILDH